MYVTREGDDKMSKKEAYEAKTEELVLPITEEYGFELVDVEYVKEGSTWYLRVYIDKPGGITVDDCELVNRRMNELLDELDYIEDSYIFEVSSPGLGRPLKKDKDFNRSIGEEVEVHLFRPIEKQKEWIGLLKAFDKDTVTLELEDGNEMTIERKAIALIRLTFDF
jgi:ribosome maturation factor RimP